MLSMCSQKAHMAEFPVLFNTEHCKGYKRIWGNTIDVGLLRKYPFWGPFVNKVICLLSASGHSKDEPILIKCMGIFFITKNLVVGLHDKSSYIKLKFYKSWF